MRPKLPFTGVILLLVAFFLPDDVEAQTIFKGKAGLGVVDNAIDTFQNSVVPSFLRFVNGEIADGVFQSRSVPINLFFGTVSGRFDLGINSIALVEDVEGISVKVDPGDDDTSVRFGAAMESISAILDQFTMGISLRVLGADFSCGVSVDASASLPPVGFGVISGLDRQNQAATLAAESIQLAFPRFQIGTPLLNCGGSSMNLRDQNAVIGLVTSEINNFLNTVTNVADDAISSIQDNFISRFGVIRLPLPPALEFDVFPGRTLMINPEITRLRADSNPVTNIAADANSAFQARLSQPAHRAGSSFVNDPLSVDNVPDPGSDQLINFHVSADGLNSLFMPSWYLMWSTLATDPKAMESTLCDAIPTDSCPFPPVRQAAGTFSNILLSLATLPIFGPMTNFNFEVVGNPPRIDFDPNNFITGGTVGRLLVRGTPLLGGEEQELVLLGIATDVSARIPNYDSLTGFFSGFALDSNFRVEEAEVDGFLGGLAEWALRGPVSSAVNFAFNFGAINGILNDALGRIPFKVPDIPIPLLDVTLRTEFAGAFGESVPAKASVGSFLRFGSDFIVRATPDKVESVTIARSVFETSAYAAAASRTNSDSSTTFTTMVYDPKNGETKAFTVRRGETGLEQLNGAVWLPVQ